MLLTAELSPQTQAELGLTVGLNSSAGSLCCFHIVRRGLVEDIIKDNCSRDPSRAGLSELLSKHT